MDILIDATKNEMVIDDVIMPCHIENDKAEIMIEIYKI